MAKGEGDVPPGEELLQRGTAGTPEVRGRRGVLSCGRTDLALCARFLPPAAPFVLLATYKLYVCVALMF